MSKLQELINRLCPNGVDYSKLIDVANVLYGFPFNSKEFTEDSNHIPLIRIRDVKPAKASTFYTGEYSEDYIIRRGDILVGMDGNFNLEKWNDRCSTNEFAKLILKMKLLSWMAFYIIF